MNKQHKNIIIIIVIYKLRYCYLQKYFPHSAEGVAVIFEVNIYMLLWTSRRYFKKHGLAERKWIGKLPKVLICSWIGVTATHSQELQLNHLLCSFGHCATFSTLDFHKCCEICATKSFKIVFPSLLESKEQVKKGRFCFVKFWNVEWPWNWDVTRKKHQQFKEQWL